MKPTRHAMFLLLSAGLLSLGLSACLPPRPAVTSQEIRYVEPGCPGCDATDSDRDGVADSRDRCPGTPAGVKVYLQMERFESPMHPIGYPGCPLDADADGVGDYLDTCPETPRGARVDVAGCPADTDRDGVTDEKDRCPDTPKGWEVDAAGCVIDNDGDGVGDKADRCPGTPRGARVDAVGCWNLEIIRFATGSARVDVAAMPLINDLMNVLARNPGLRLEIQGHTDNVASETVNEKLSLDRANAVRDAMVGRGASPEQLSVQGFGTKQPIALNRTEEGRSYNRRVAFQPLF